MGTAVVERVPYGNNFCQSPISYPESCARLSGASDMNPTPQPVCWIVAGPNGAGKTTFALDYLPRVAGCRTFVNADLIASGLAPLAPNRRGCKRWRK